MIDKDPYEVLQLSKNASSDDIKKAYKNLVKQWHPDHFAQDPVKHQQATKKMQEINAAYDILKNDDTRQEYDDSTKRYTDDLFSNSYTYAYEDMLNNMMNNHFWKKKQNKQYEVTISLEDAYNGKIANVLIPVKEQCSVCKGTGQINGNMRCAKCRGRGSLENKKEIQIKIPEGINDKEIIKYKNVDIVINIKPHKWFIRQENDLYCELPITFTQAILGDKVIVPTLSNNIEITIPPLVQNGQTLKISGKGMKGFNTVGNLYFQLKILMPKEIDNKQKQILSELKFDNYPDELNKFN